MRYLILSLIFCGCYSRPVAVKQHGRAAATYPDIAADYCARVYPAKDSLIQGATITRVDTLLDSGEVIIIRDTLRSHDTVYIRITKVLPGTVITRTIHRTDTVYIENTAALELSRGNERKAVAGWNVETNERKKYQGRARKYLFGLIGAGALVGLWIFFKFRKKK